MDEQREYLLDEREDAALAALMDEYAQAEGEALWAAFEEAERSGALPEMPKELDDKCRKRIGASEKKPARICFLNRIGLGMRRAAVFVLVFLCLGSAVVLSADALRLPVLNFFIVDKGRYSSILFRSEIKPEEKTLMDKVLEVTPPDGYQLEEYDEDSIGTFRVRYKDNTGTVLWITFIPSINGINYDTEDVTQIPIKLHDKDAIYICKRGYRIMWADVVADGVFDVVYYGANENDFLKYVYRLAAITNEKED